MCPLKDPVANRKYHQEYNRKRYQDKMSEVLPDVEAKSDNLADEPVELKGYREAFSPKPLRNETINPPNHQRLGDYPNGYLARAGGEMHPDGSFGWVSICPFHGVKFDAEGNCPICKRCGASW